MCYNEYLLFKVIKDLSLCQWRKKNTFKQPIGFIKNLIEENLRW